MTGSRLAMTAAPNHSGAGLGTGPLADRQSLARLVAKKRRRFNQGCRKNNFGPLLVTLSSHVTKLPGVIGCCVTPRRTASLHGTGRHSLSNQVAACLWRVPRLLKGCCEPRMAVAVRERRIGAGVFNQGCSTLNT